MSDQTGDSLRDSRFRELLRRVMEGDASASEDIVTEYGPHILRAVRRHMNRRLRDRFDSEDFAQAVWGSFFGHLSVVDRIQSEGELAGFLGRMASNKVIDAGRRRQFRSEENSAGNKLSDVEMDLRRHVTQPTPSQFAVANEEFDVLAENEDDRNVKLLNLRRAGATQAEIAESMGVSERHVRRILARISRKLNDAPDSATGEDGPVL